jgi:hypothetical protein
MQVIGLVTRPMPDRFAGANVLESANAATNAIVVSFMFSPSLFTKQQMELPFDHSTKSLVEILREAATSANRHPRYPYKLGPLLGTEIREIS